MFPPIRAVQKWATSKNCHSYVPSLINNPKMSQQKKTTFIMYLPFCAVQKWASRKQLPFLCYFHFAQPKNEPEEKNYHYYVPSLLRSPKMSQQKKTTFIMYLPFCAAQKWARRKKLPLLCTFPFAQSKNEPAEKTLERKRRLNIRSSFVTEWRLLGNNNAGGCGTQLWGAYDTAF
jgi:hypothetical protein